MLRSILHWKKFSDNITNLFLSVHQELSLKNRQKNCQSIDVVVFTSSENLSTKKPCSFLESLDISKQ